MPAPVCFAALAAIAASQEAESPSDEASRDIVHRQLETLGRRVRGRRDRPEKAGG